MSSDSDDYEFTYTSRKNFEDKRKLYVENEEKFRKDVLVNNRKFHSDLEVEEFMKEWQTASNENFYQRDPKQSHVLSKKKVKRQIRKSSIDSGDICVFTALLDLLRVQVKGMSSK